MTENAGENQTPGAKPWQFQPGQSGNPVGKPKGARNAATLAAEALLDGETEATTRKAVELAKAGDHNRNPALSGADHAGAEVPQRVIRFAGSGCGGGSGACVLCGAGGDVRWRVWLRMRR